MISIKIVHKGKDIHSVECQGHAEYAESGKDIICSAVSAVIQTALLGLMDTSKKDVLFERREGYLKFICPPEQNREEKIRQQAILKTMYIGLKDLQSGYKAFIEVEDI